MERDGRRSTRRCGRGNRGLPGGDSLPQLLARELGMRNVQALPQLTIKQILALDDDHQRRTGAWLAKSGGPVLAEPSENWRSVDNGLRSGLRGLPGDKSLAKLLSRHRGVLHRKMLPPYTVRQVLAWTDAYHAKHGKWPREARGRSRRRRRDVDVRRCGAKKRNSRLAGR